MLIATLPPVYRQELMEKIISHPLIDGVRYNVGYATPYSPRETLEWILALIKVHNKKFWIDLKGRQLRIVHWAAPNYGTIILNHEIEVDCPATIFFRGNEWSELKVVKGNQIYVDPPPAKAVGNGQAINIHGNNLKIKGYLTKDDCEYIKEACDLGILNFMLSFVEEIDDLVAVENILKENSGYKSGSAQFVLKIESPRGLEFIDSISAKTFEKHPIMAARDDLMINIGQNKATMLKALEKIVLRNPEAILASRIFSGLETNGEVTMGNWSDIRLMQLMGYKHFMLSDGICGKYFDEAIVAWQDYLNVFSERG